MFLENDESIVYFALPVVSTEHKVITPVKFISKSKLKHKCIYKGKCPHRGYDLSQETPINGVITCPLHGLKFDVKTKKNNQKSTIIMDHEEEQTLGQRVAAFIKEKRTALGMSQRQFAIHVFGDITKQAWICNIETNKKGLTLDTAGRILKALNADVDIIEF